MGLFNNFPFTNFQEKNLDCIYKLAKEANEKSDETLETVSTITDLFELNQNPIRIKGQAKTLFANNVVAPVITGADNTEVDNAQTVYGIYYTCDQNAELISICNHLGLTPSLTHLCGQYTSVVKTSSANVKSREWVGIFQLLTQSTANQPTPYIITRHYYRNGDTYLDSGFKLYNLSTLAESY